MVQTDKPKYKPGDFVNMRAFFIHSSGQAVSTANLKNFHIEIHNSFKEPIFTRTSSTYKVKVYTYQLKLDEEALTGNYTIFVWTNIEDSESNENEIIKSDFLTTEDASFQQNFSVEKYVLPEFELKVNTQKFVRPWNDIVVRIHAKYSFGKYVLGSARVKAALNGKPFYSEEVSVNYEGFAVIRMNKNLLSKNGKNEVKIDVEFEDLLSQRKLSKTVFVSVHKTIKKTLILDPSTHSKFKPGQPFSMNVYIKDVDGSFVENSDDFVEMSVKQSYKVQKCEDARGLFNFSTTIDLKLQKVKNGVAQFIINDVPLNTSVMSFTAKYETLTETFIVGRSLTPSQQYLKVTAE